MREEVGVNDCGETINEIMHTYLNYVISHCDTYLVACNNECLSKSCNSF